MLLIGTTALQPNMHNGEGLPGTLTIAPRLGRDRASELLVEYGLPHTTPKKLTAMYSSIDGKSCTWLETVFILYLHKTVGPEWRKTPVKELAEYSGVSINTAGKCLQRLIFLERVQKEIAPRLPGQPFIMRLPPRTAAAIDRGDIHHLDAAAKTAARIERLDQW